MQTNKFFMKAFKFICLPQVFRQINFHYSHVFHRTKATKCNLKSPTYSSKLGWMWNRNERRIPIKRNKSESFQIKLQDGKTLEFKCHPRSAVNWKNKIMLMPMLLLPPRVSIIYEIASQSVSSFFLSFFQWILNAKFRKRCRLKTGKN